MLLRSVSALSLLFDTQSCCSLTVSSKGYLCESVCRTIFLLSSFCGRSFHCGVQRRKPRWWKYKPESHYTHCDRDTHIQQHHDRAELKRDGGCFRHERYTNRLGGSFQRQLYFRRHYA